MCWWQGCVCGISRAVWLKRGKVPACLKGKEYKNKADNSVLMLVFVWVMEFLIRTGEVQTPRRRAASATL